MNIPAAKIYFPEEDREKIVEKVGEVLTTGQLTLGKYGREFEEKFGVRLSGEVYELPWHLQPVFKESFGFWRRLPSGRGFV